MKLVLTFLLLIFFVKPVAYSQKSNDVYVDKDGVMRWGNTKEEVKGFGVNYTVPFAYAYRVAKQLNVSPEKAIDDDVYHFSRLGFDLYRVHVWDTEISDTLGNLLENEHLKLLDYALKKMKDRGIRFVLTPIAYWGNGWPEKDEKTPGFSRKYGKAACLTNPDAIKAQQNYLSQFLNHVNPYTGVAYKNEPDLIAFEISNEPQHGGKASDVTAFINGMVSSMRKTGCKKPVFYNISHSIHLAQGYFDADIQGGTFQWYPTGLQAKHEIMGNLLPNVDDYKIPFAANPRFKQMAKIVYEFDAADVGRSYIYPAMARSFRTAGMQLATHFAYDPTFFAYANTEYDTHYMNLIYTPQKALSLKIASEVFHNIPLYKDFGKFPADTSFGDFRVSYGQDLAEMVTKEKFIYTNHTTTIPPNTEALEHISGSGNSTVVKYEGTGAYFLDKLENGVWRLEILPDAIWVQDPFGFNALDKVLTVINWRQWPMSVRLPDLGEDFEIRPLNQGNDTKTFDTQKQTFNITPGTYLLSKKGVSSKLNATSKWKNMTLNEFVAPATTLQKTYVLHSPAKEISAGESMPVKVQIVSLKQPEAASIKLFVKDAQPVHIDLEHTGGYQFSARIPAELLKGDAFKYCILVKENGVEKQYPSEQENIKVGNNDQEKLFETRILTKSSPITLFSAAADHAQLLRPYLKTSRLTPLTETGNSELNINPEKAEDYAMRYNFKNNIAGRISDLLSKTKLVFHGRALNEKPCTIQLALIGKDGSVYGAKMNIKPENNPYAVLLEDLKKTDFISLPRPYPGFLPYSLDTTLKAGNIDLMNIETLQIVIIPTQKADPSQKTHAGIAIQNVNLE
ncbi:membrane or secreted protein [Dyadobacter sp. CY345]|uniref:membrane or secreted protein n=1 Tax=Dyadobacter sp. CY345 TaxID=2909335 RepID=UPI001F2B4D1F|nr:membrane or secreted protein [Dyadobacter sp. CY345]MCF2447625.1 membrane or secreted protein [Dyadobacter sp. CY345]